MRKQTFVIIALFFIAKSACSQAAVDSLLKLGNGFYRKNDFAAAAAIFERAASITENKLAKNTNYYYASSAYASAKDSSNSFRCLEMAIKKWGFNDLNALLTDESYFFLKKSHHWKQVVSLIKPVYTSNPRAVKVIDTDVKNFWKAFDMAQVSPPDAIKIYNDNYINKGTMALQFYYLNKIDNMENFVLVHNACKKYYASIRANTFKAAQLKAVYEKSFVNLKNIYPAAIFPPIYFVVGKLNSAGTVSGDGLILGIDQACMSSSADTTELNTWEKHNISTFQRLPNTVAHELIHYEQKGMAGDTTLLSAAIKEGMADFICELISGKFNNHRLLLYAKGKEKIIWGDFKKEMNLDRSYNWLANSEQETADKPADLGYWVGYQICKAYYERATNKKKAIDEMLHIHDYKLFLEQSRLDEKFK